MFRDVPSFIFKGSGVYSLIPQHLKMKTTRFFETSGNTNPTTRRHTPEGVNFQELGCLKTKYRLEYSVLRGKKWKEGGQSDRSLLFVLSVSYHRRD